MLLTSPYTAGDDFGVNVAVHVDTIVVGSRFDDDKVGLGID